MKNQIHFDSEELFDTTSTDSEEEYIPKTKNVHPDSDPDEACESGSEGSKLTSSQREEDAPSDVNHDDASPQQSTTAPQNTKQPRSPKTERGKFSETGLKSD
ncbi:uncharacterized protein LOC121188656 [Xyrichtys novacula]|uniref:Uncharacterized protein LOC121188656 n=1 Tax=Xyrichtys novacula TaxID=13765 RepID=A0AAV1HN00_XYRNO|nr:uncharacterized protein LOC121188656 [Xyrichtys novacula]